MKFYAAVCAFCQIEQIKGRQNPISKLAQLFFQIEQMKRRENPT